MSFKTIDSLQRQSKIIRSEVNCALDIISGLLEDRHDLKDGDLTEMLRKVDTSLGVARGGMMKLKQHKTIMALLEYLLENGKLKEQNGNGTNKQGNR
jgi:hypothetical protein